MIMSVKDLINLLNKFDEKQYVMINADRKGLQSINDVISVKLFEDDVEECVLLDGFLKGDSDEII